jgi:hypothetical protein
MLAVEKLEVGFGDTDRAGERSPIWMGSLEITCTSTELPHVPTLGILLQF